MRLQDLMNRNVETVSPETTAEQALTRMKMKAYRHLVVMKNGSVLGVVSERDLGGRRGLGSHANDPIGEFMSGRVVTGTPEMTVRQAAKLMRGHVVGCLPVVDGGKLKGMITVSDLLEAIGRGIEKPINRTDRAMLSRRHGRKQKGHA